MANEFASSPINTVPDGLLGLLNVKSLGKNPSFMSGVVQPIVDLMPFYIHNLQRYLHHSIVGGSETVNHFQYLRDPFPDEYPWAGEVMYQVPSNALAIVTAATLLADTNQPTVNGYAQVQYLVVGQGIVHTSERLSVGPDWVNGGASDDRLLVLSPGTRVRVRGFGFETPLGAGETSTLGFTLRYTEFLI